MLCLNVLGDVMNKHIQRLSACWPHNQQKETLDEDERSRPLAQTEELKTQSAPEISVYLADEENLLEVDSYTGLPKLPVELPEGFDSSTASSASNSNHSLGQAGSARSSLIKMTTSPGKRKSVTFDPSTEFEKQEDGHSQKKVSTP